MAKTNDTYDIVAAIEAIENELTASMIRNMKRHKLEEIKEDKQWSMWQAEMLKSLEVYKKQNQEKYGTVFRNINAQISALIQAANEEGQMDQEKQILNAIQNGLKARRRISPGGTAEFFKVNDRKLEALIQATTHDMERAEVAVLRRAEDQYRQVIYNAQVYANTGAGTYEKAVDMATKDFLRAGINCVQYANGARHTLKDYADMAIRTASKRAYLQGEGEKRQEWGLHLVIMNKRGNPCPLCLPFVGKILIDDVWSGGSSADGPYRLMSTAIKAGLYHPRCKDSHTTYFPGLSSVDARYNKKELAAVEKQAKEEARQQYAERQADAYGRMAEHSLDAGNRQQYAARRDAWGEQAYRPVMRGESEKIEQPENLQNVTSQWIANTDNPGQVTDLSEYIVGGVKYEVNGKTIILDYSKHERDVADVLAKSYGKNVEMVPRITYPQGISTPDFRIDGVGWDLKTISTEGKNVLYNAVKKKKRQASCFMFDITNCTLESSEIQKQINDLFRSTHMTFIDSVGLYKNGQIVGIFKRKEK